MKKFVAERKAKSEAKKVARKQKNLKIGTERLNNRIDKANKEADRLSRRIGWRNTEQAGKEFKRMENIRDVSKSILGDEERTIALGDYTRKVRNRIVTATAISSVAAYGSSAAFLGSVVGGSAVGILATPVIPAAAVGVAGYKYYRKTKY